MMKALSCVLPGRDDYVIMHGEYLEVVLYSGDRWKKVFRRVIAVFATWMGDEEPEIRIAPDCEERLRAWEALEGFPSS